MAGLVCSLCLEDMTPGNDLESTICAHTFHHECLAESYRLGPRRCPICKLDQPVPPPVVVPAASAPPVIEGPVVVDDVPSPSLRRFRAEFPSAFESDSENAIDDEAYVDSDEHMDDGEQSGDGAGVDAEPPLPKAKAKAKSRPKAKPIAAKAITKAKGKGKAKSKPAAAKAESAARSRRGSADAAANEDMDIDDDNRVGEEIPSPKAKGKGKAKGKAKPAAAKAKSMAKAKAAPEAAPKAIAKSKGKSKGKAKPAAATAKSKVKAKAAPQAPPADGGASGSNDVLVTASNPGGGGGGAIVPHSLAAAAFGQVTCGSCGRVNHFSSVRLMNKGSGYYKCNGCFVKTSQLRRLLGSWPSEQFTSLPKDCGWLLVHTCTSSGKAVSYRSGVSPLLRKRAAAAIRRKPSGATADNYRQRTPAVVGLHPLRHRLHFSVASCLCMCVISQPPKERQVAFMEAIATMTGGQAAEEARKLELTEVESESWADSGEFLPLSVWGNRGFDTERIRSRSSPADVREDLVLGTVYRVKVMSLGTSGSRSLTSSHVVQRTGEAAKPLLALEDGDADGSDAELNCGPGRVATTCTNVPERA